MPFFRKIEKRELATIIPLCRTCKKRGSYG
jgi:hypothetical protein